MAQGTEDLNRVYGRVVVLETGVGVPELVVELYDWDARLAPKLLAKGAAVFGGDRAPTRNRIRRLSVSRWCCSTGSVRC